MPKIVYTQELMKLMSLFEGLTRVDVRDCFIDQNQLLWFIVEEGTIARAVGKNGSNVHRLEGLLKRKIKIVEFNPTPEQFLLNMIHPLKVSNLTEEEGIFTLEGDDEQSKGLLIGKNARNLRNYEEVMRRYFDVKEIRVV